MSEPELLQWFLTTCSLNLVKLCNEGPVFEFITFLHRNSKLSSTFLKSINSASLTDVSKWVSQIKRLFKIKILDMIYVEF